MSEPLEWDIPTNSAPPNEDNPFRNGDWVTWANLVKGVNLGPFLIINSSVHLVLVVDPEYVSSEEGTWKPASLFQKYDPEEHLRHMIEYWGIVKGRSSLVL